MTRTTVMTIAAALGVALLAGCSPKDPDNTPTGTEQTDDTQEQGEPGGSPVAQAFISGDAQAVADAIHTEDDAYADFDVAQVAAAWEAATGPTDIDVKPAGDTETVTFTVDEQPGQLATEQIDGQWKLTGVPVELLHTILPPGLVIPGFDPTTNATPVLPGTYQVQALAETPMFDADGAQLTWTDSALGSGVALPWRLTDAGNDVVLQAVRDAWAACQTHMCSSPRSTGVGTWDFQLPDAPFTSLAELSTVDGEDPAWQDTVHLVSSPVLVQFYDDTTADPQRERSVTIAVTISRGPDGMPVVEVGELALQG